MEVKNKLSEEEIKDIYMKMIDHNMCRICKPAKVPGIRYPRSCNSDIKYKNFNDKIVNIIKLQDSICKYISDHITRKKSHGPVRGSAYMVVKNPRHRRKLAIIAVLQMLVGDQIEKGHNSGDLYIWNASKKYWEAGTYNTAVTLAQYAVAYAGFKVRITQKHVRYIFYNLSHRLNFSAKPKMFIPNIIVQKGLQPAEGFIRELVGDDYSYHVLKAFIYGICNGIVANIHYMFVNTPTQIIKMINHIVGRQYISYIPVSKTSTGCTPRIINSKNHRADYVISNKPCIFPESIIRSYIVFVDCTSLQHPTFNLRCSNSCIRSKTSESYPTLIQLLSSKQYPTRLWHIKHTGQSFFPVIVFNKLKEGLIDDNLVSVIAEWASDLAPLAENTPIDKIPDSFDIIVNDKPIRSLNNIIGYYL